MRRRVTKVVLAVAGAALLGGCASASAPPISAKQLAYSRSFNLFTVYWAGRSMDGIPLVEADGIGDYLPPSGITMYYGNCLHKSFTKLGGCTLPLEITTVWYIPHSNKSLGAQRNVRLRGVPAVIFNHGDEAELYTDETLVDVIGATPKLTMEGVEHLTPLNRAPSAAWPAFPQPVFKPGVSEKQLAAAKSGATGASGASGATGVDYPPGDLQPDVNPSQ
jgi:hypothetical protein